MDNRKERGRQSRSSEGVDTGLTHEGVIGKDVHMRWSNRLSAELLFMKHEGNRKPRIAEAFRPERPAGWR